MPVRLITLLMVMLAVGCSSDGGVIVSSPQAIIFNGPGLAAQRFVQYKQGIHEKAAASVAEEEDLTKQSIKAISVNKTPQAINVYQRIAQDGNMTESIRRQSLYQIGLIHMNRLNDRRNDGEALKVFNDLLIECPDLNLCSKVNDKIAILNERKEITVHYNPNALANIRGKMSRRAAACMAEEPELLPESARAISEGRTAPLIKGLLHLYLDTQEEKEVRAQALYQVGLIYMNTNNAARNDKKAIFYMRQIQYDFPDSSICDGLDVKIAEIKSRHTAQAAR